MKYSLFQAAPETLRKAKLLTELITANTEHRNYFLVSSHEAFYGMKAICSDCGETFWFKSDMTLDWQSVINNGNTHCDHLRDLADKTRNIAEAMKATDEAITKSPEKEVRLELILSLIAAQTIMKVHKHQMGGIIEVENNGSYGYLIACADCDKTLFVRSDGGGDPEKGFMDGALLREPCMPPFLSGLIDAMTSMMKDRFGTDDVKVRVGKLDSLGHEIHDTDKSDLSDLGRMLFDAINEPHLFNPLDKRDRILMNLPRERLNEIAAELAQPARCSVCDTLLGSAEIAGSGHHFDITTDGKVLHFCKEHCPHCGRNSPGSPTNDPHLS